jgi:hypothetical protein
MMLSENLRGFLRAAAWLLIVVGLILTVWSGLRQLGLVSPGIVNVNGEPFSAVLNLLLGAASSVVQGGLILVLLSIDERIQNRGI